MEEEKIVENSKKMGLVMRNIMENLKEKHPSVGDVRSIGLFGALELVKNRKTKEPMAPFNGTSEGTIKVAAFLKENGIYAFNYGHILHTNPPLVVNEQELKDAFNIVDKALDIADKYTN